jgi:hypothetical protein
MVLIRISLCIYFHGEPIASITECMNVSSIDERFSYEGTEEMVKILSLDKPSQGRYTQNK